MQAKMQTRLYVFGHLHRDQPTPISETHVRHKVC